MYHTCVHTFIYINATPPISELPFSTRPHNHIHAAHLSCQLLCGSKQYACTRRAPCTAEHVGKDSGCALRVCAWTHQANTREAWHLAASCKQANGVCYLQARRAALVCSHETDASAPRPPPAIASPHTRSVSHQREQHQHLLGEDTRKTGSATLAKRPCCSGVMLCH